MVTSKGHGGVSQNRKRRVIGKHYADKGQRRRAARFHRHPHAEFSRASSPVALRPPHPWPKAGHCGVASSLFCFERDPQRHSHRFQKAKLLRFLSSHKFHVLRHENRLQTRPAGFLPVSRETSPPFA